MANNVKSKFWTGALDLGPRLPQSGGAWGVTGSLSGIGSNGGGATGAAEGDRVRVAHISGSSANGVMSVGESSPPKFTPNASIGLSEQ
jgi:hypothetical protein